VGARGVSSCPSVAGVDYRYELRRGDEVVATGHLTYAQPLEVGVRIEIGGQPGIVRTVEPLPLHPRHFRPLTLTPSLPAIQHRQQEMGICRDFQAL